MSNLPIQDKPTFRACVASWITVLFAAALFLLRLPDSLHDFFRPYTSMPVDQWVMLSYSFWLLALLWVAHRDWLKSSASREEAAPALAYARR